MPLMTSITCGVTAVPGCVPVFMSLSLNLHLNPTSRFCRRGNKGLQSHCAWAGVARLMRGRMSLERGSPLEAEFLTALVCWCSDGFAGWQVLRAQDLPETLVRATPGGRRAEEL